MSDLKQYILEKIAAKELPIEKAKVFLQDLDAASKASEKMNREFAIIGMSGRFPKSENIDEFWHHLRDGVSCIDDYPEHRKKDNEHILHNPSYMEYVIGDPVKPKDRDDVYAHAGYLKETDKFDSGFFGIPPSEAIYMDPSQRLVLETAWDAMEDAGYGGEQLRGSNTGVFIGKEGTNFSLYRFNQKKDPMQLTGSWESIIGSRISYLFDFKGPCMLVDTACSASLVSVHMAMNSIMQGECDTALAGGVNIIAGELKPKYQGGMSMDSVESEDSIIRTFDANANGTVWGEGVALIMLKPLAKALKDGDHIHAVIKGSAINNDGSSNGLTAPNAEAQEEVILKAWENADINPETLSYIEAHGTGTVLGDPIEFKGLTRAFRKSTNKRQFCAIGSLKTNMGHLVASSGIASLFKVVKSMQTRQLAPSINFNQPNPFIDFADSPLYVTDHLQDWTVEKGPRRAGISSFGFSHTNCHMIVEEAPEQVAGTVNDDGYLFTVSAKKQELLLDYIDLYKDYCGANEWNLADLCFTAATGRGHYNHRLCIFAKDETDFLGKLSKAETIIDGVAGSTEDMYYGAHTIVSDRKKTREEGELTGKEKKSRSNEVATIIAASDHGMDQDAMRSIALNYSLGGDVDWYGFYKNESRNRLSQPTYPFEKIRTWAPPKITRVKNTDTSVHPLIDMAINQSDTEWVYESEFDCESQWVLSDHKISETCVVPGTTYLEMARAVFTHATGEETLELNDVFFLQPMVVPNEEARTVQCILSKVDDKYRFLIKSKNAEAVEDEWIEHVEAQIIAIDNVDTEIEDIDRIKSTATEFVEDYQIETDTGVFQFGPHWDSIRQTWTTPDISLAMLELPPQFSSELNDFKIHPSVLDNAMNLTSQDGEATYLPFMYKSFRFYSKFTPKMYSHITVYDDVNNDAETHNYDVKLTDHTGKLVGEVTGYITKKLNNFDLSGDSGTEKSYLKRRWKLSENTTKRESSAPVLLVSNGNERSSKLADEWRNLGVDVRHVSIGANSQFEPTEAGMKSLIDSDQSRDIGSLVFAVDFDMTNDTGNYLATNELFQSHRSCSVDALFHLGKAMLDAKMKLPDGLTILTSDVYEVDGSESELKPLGAATGMLGKTLALENPGLECYMLDVTAKVSASEILQQLPMVSPRFINTLRASDLYEQEMYSVEPSLESGYEYKADGAYVITGGLGGLGLRAAQHVASKVKGNVVLLGRSEFPDASKWNDVANGDDKRAAKCQALLALEKDLSSLSYIQVDVSNAEQVNRTFSQIRNTYGVVHGVFHAAGTAGDGFIINKTFDVFNAVLSPKLQGTLNLLHELESDKPDFLALYSSITAVTGGQGQSDYAAANAFLDAIVPVGQASNINVIATNWPSWEDVGMAVDYEVDHDQSPFAPIHSDEAMQCFDSIVKRGDNLLLPSAINASIYNELVETVPVGLSDELTRILNRSKNSDADSQDTLVDVQIAGKSSDDLTEHEVMLSRIYGTVLGVDQIDIYANFQDMGGNSIIATHLLKVIESIYPGLVDISDIFSYPSVDVMAEYIGSKTADSEEVDSVAAESSSDIDWESMIDQLVDGEENLDKLLEEV